MKVGWRHLTDVLHYAVVYPAHRALGGGTLSKGWFHLLDPQNNKPIKNVVWTTVSQAQRWQFYHYYYTFAKQPMKRQNCALLLVDWSLLHSLVGFLNLEVHTAGDILYSPAALWSPHSQGRREAIKSKTLQLKLFRADRYEFPPFKTNGVYCDTISKSKSENKC